MRWIRIKYTKWYNILKDGISKNNPIVVAVLGICSALAVTNRVENAIAMGLGVTFVVMASSLMISLIRNFIPAKVRMVTYMVVISTFVILFQMFLEAYFPSIAKALGAYVGLIITNCIVMGRAEAFAAKNPVKYSIIDGFASGMGYMLVLVLVASVREILAFGTFLNMNVTPDSWVNWTVMAMAPGGFFVLGLFIWGIRELIKHYETA
ncbi:MAG: electron transport complex subunit RsxE [Acholeplasmataceae bacterium]|jgi:Na+-transporting NADH:ubiquinone oxidoreductase subunit D|nr:electron transport complex subunit RsxE [Acholeplasmataceae bacterium]MDY0338140.1 electron transport complex subunit RsxE [Acholeplasmataceae bacterium]